MENSRRAFRCIVTLLNRNGMCWGKFLENSPEFSFEGAVACVCVGVWGGASSGVFLSMVLYGCHPGLGTYCPFTRPI